MALAAMTAEAGKVGGVFEGRVRLNAEDCVHVFFFFRGEVVIGRFFRKGRRGPGEVKGFGGKGFFQGVIERVTVTVVVELGVGADEAVEGFGGAGDGVADEDGGFDFLVLVVEVKQVSDGEAQDGDLGVEIVVGHFAQGVEILAGEARGVDAVLEGVGGVGGGVHGFCPSCL